jgi:hypothetical protein
MRKDDKSMEVKKGISDDLYKPDPTLISLFSFDKHQNGFTLWYNVKSNGNRLYHSKSLSFGNYYGVWEKPNEISFRDNGANKDNTEDTCYDCTLTLGKITFGYTNWSY